METILSFLKGTPFWVYLVFAYIIWMGIKAKKTHRVSLRKMVFLPLAFMTLSLYALIMKPHAVFNISIWITVALSGSYIGWSLTQKLRVEADKKKKQLQLPGGYTTLFLLFSIFSVKYFFGALYASNPLVKENTLINTMDILISGFITGVFVGRAFSYVKKYQAAEHIDLSAE